MGVLIGPVAKRQEGVISVAQLHALGITYRQVGGLVTRGYLHSLHRGVYLYGDGTMTADGHCVAALLSTQRDDAWLSGRASAAVRKLRGFDARAIDVTVPTTGVARRRGLVLHATTTRPHEDEIRIERGLRVSSVPLMLIELARHEKPAELERIIDLTVRRRLLNIDAMEAALRRRRGEPGTARLMETTVAFYMNRIDRKSNLERAFDAYLRKHHADIPDPERNVHLGRWEIDCYWPAERVVIELDGRPYHCVISDQARDNAKNAWLSTQNIRFLRVTDAEFELDPESAFRNLRAILKLGTTSDQPNSSRAAGGR